MNGVSFLRVTVTDGCFQKLLFLPLGSACFDFCEMQHRYAYPSHTGCSPEYTQERGHVTEHSDSDLAEGMLQRVASAGDGAGQQCFRGSRLTRQGADASRFENRRWARQNVEGQRRPVGSTCEASVSRHGDDTGAEMGRFGGPLTRQCLPARGDVGTDRELCISLPSPTTR